MENFKSYLNNIIQFTSIEKDTLLSLFSKQNLQKKDYFAKEGEYSNKLAFLDTGVMRAYYQNQEGQEYNKTFFTSAHFVAAYSSIVTGCQNLINIQCLTDCSFWVADFRMIVQLYDKYPKIERLSRIIAEHKFIIKEKREIELATLDASKRYEIFKTEHPNLENQIPQYHIASYLGVSATQLSRIRAQK